MEATILNFRENGSHRDYFYLTLIVLWPYFGAYNEINYQISIIILTIFLLLISGKKGFYYSVLASIFGMIVFCAGQIAYGTELTSLREVLRIIIWVSSFAFGYRYASKFPFLTIAILMAISIYVSKIYHPNIPWIANTYGATPQMNDSYHNFRTIMFGGMPATSGYIFVIISSWGTLMYLKSKISSVHLVLGYSVLLALIISTLSRLPLILFFTLNVSLLCLKSKSRQFLALTLVTFFSVGFIIIEYYALTTPDRWVSLSTASHRLSSVPYMFDLLNEENYRIFPGCLFHRGCHYDGSIRSISTDGGLLYLLINWGLPLISILGIFIFTSIFYSLLKLELKYTIILVLGLVISIFDPLATDPKSASLWMITLGYAFSKGKRKTDLKTLSSKKNESALEDK